MNFEIPVTDDIAVIDNDGMTTYYELNKYVGKIIDTLEDNGVTQGSVAAIMMKRSVFMIASIIAVLKIGVTYTLIDKNIPLERQQYILRNCNSNVLLSDIENYEVKCVNIPKIIQEDTSVQPYIDNNISSSSSAYILYTSGTTGMPKGVEITREGLYNFINGVSQIIDFTMGKRIACFTTVSFDIFFLESIMALCKGLTVVLASEEEQHNPRLMAKLIKVNHVDMIQMTPSGIQMLLNYDKELNCLTDVKEIMIGGESFPISLLRALQRRTKAKIYNMYGPTETTIWSTISELTFKDHIDIGRPIVNTKIYIVDENLRILPNGQVGEICISGKGLAKGYIEKQPMLTNEKFVYLPEIPNERVYKTGDIGRYMSDGSLECLGRMDNQVKIRGHRIELEEIESNLNGLEGIIQSIVFVSETDDNNKILEAFYTSDKNIDEKDIKNYLMQKLPEYMIPHTFKRVYSFVKTQNGKIDRKKIPECIEVNIETSRSRKDSRGKLTEIQSKILTIIKDNIDKAPSVDMLLDSDFRSLGLSSIDFIKMVVEIESEFGFEFDDDMLLLTKFKTITSMIDYVESKIEE